MTIDAIETFEVEDLTVEIHQDDDPMSPLDWDLIGTFVAFPSLAREYREGSVYHRESDRDEDEAMARRDGNGDLLERWYQMMGTELVFFYFADHGSSGARLWATDSDNPSGFAYADAATIREEYGDLSPESRAKARETLLAEIKTLGQYVEGEVFGFVVKAPDDEVLDSCWGFYDEWQLEYVKSEATDIARWHAEDRRKTAEREAREREHWANHDLSTEVTR